MNQRVLTICFAICSFLLVSTTLQADAVITTSDESACMDECEKDYYEELQRYDDILEDAKRIKENCDKSAHESYDSLVDFCKEGGWKTHWDSLAACISHMEQGRATRLAECQSTYDRVRYVCDDGKARAFDDFVACILGCVLSNPSNF